MQENKSWTEVRIFFTKTGMAKYISHLDLMRCMSRTFKRARLPLWYTEGFNPRVFLSFARPLSLGFESLCESVDVRLDGEMTFKELRERLNASLPEGITVVAVSKPVHKPSEIAFADYEINMLCSEPSALKVQLENAFSADTVTVMKKGKQGRRKVEKEIDVKPNIIAFDATETESGVKICLRLTAGDSDNINPTLLLDALTKDFEGEITNTDILKTRVLLANGENFC